jgi:hypothetical protein
LTLHRPANVDDPHTFAGIAAALNTIAETYSIFFPVHPRTRKQLDAFGIRLSDRITQLQPLGFQESLFLWKDAALTDSGGLQEETTALGIPCLTLRDNTERPVTIDEGTNVLAGTTTESILGAYGLFLTGGGKAGRVSELWDGRAAERIVGVLLPGGRKVHTHPIPRTGGLAIFMSFVLALFLVVVADTDVSRLLALNHQRIFLMIGGVICFLTGLADDFRRLPARMKLLLQILGATVAYAGGIDITQMVFMDLLKATGPTCVRMKMNNSKRWPDTFWSYRMSS